MATIINMTPHVINICDPNKIHFESSIRKWVADDPATAVIKSIPSAGVLNARISTVDGDSIDGIPTFEKAIDGCDPLPDDAPDAIFIVSALFASAFIKRGGDPARIMLVADPVMTADGTSFVGCRGLAKPF
jgi:hypothetical protein